MQQLLTTAQWFGISSDVWSSLTMQPYLSLTVHFIDVNFVLHAKCLSVCYFPESHTGKTAVSYESMTMCMSKISFRQDVFLVVVSPSHHEGEFSTEEYITYYMTPMQNADSDYKYNFLKLVLCISSSCEIYIDNK